MFSRIGNRPFLAKQPTLPPRRMTKIGGISPQLKEECDRILRAMDLDPSEVAIEVRQLNRPTAQAYPATTYFPPKIVIDKSFLSVENNEALHFAIAHEATHLKERHTAIPTALHLSVAIGASAIAARKKGIYALPILGAATILRALQLINQEIKADRQATVIAGGKAGKECLEGIRQANIKDRSETNWISRLEYSPTGENRLDIFHPGLKTRERLIQHWATEKEQKTQKGNDRLPLEADKAVRLPTDSEKRQDSSNNKIQICRAGPHVWLKVGTTQAGLGATTGKLPWIDALDLPGTEVKVIDHSKVNPKDVEYTDYDKSPLHHLFGNIDPEVLESELKAAMERPGVSHYLLPPTNNCVVTAINLLRISASHTQKPTQDPGSTVSN